MKYHKITQKDYCCVGACLEMILVRHEIVGYDQEDIAYELGLIVPPHLRSNYRRVREGEKPAAGYGTQIQEPQYSINHFFAKNNIELVESYHYITNLDEAKKFLTANNDQDILIILHCGTLYDTPRADWGHMIVYDHMVGDQVMLQEVSEKRNLETVQLSKVLQAIKTHGRKNGAGFYLIKQSDNPLGVTDAQSRASI